MPLPTLLPDAAPSAPAAAKSSKIQQRTLYTLAFASSKLQRKDEALDAKDDELALQAAQLQAAEDRLQDVTNEPHRPAAQQNTIPVPPNPSKTKIEEIQQMLGASSCEMNWMRTAGRHNLAAARLDSEAS
uniref:Uncharacterized protein n=1 Tax=Mycena chlorophos TaxID=658473 RepID=A0ABQ0LD20_MYCCL|nr:predicted protein [Mycena chlorophos]